MDTKHTFNISIKLNWKATREVVKKLYLRLREANTRALEIDDITSDMHSQGHVQYSSNLFRNVVYPFTPFHFITLNYPRLQEQHLYISNISIQVTTSPVTSAFRW